MSGATWTCPACGLVYPLERLRKALATRVPQVGCACGLLLVTQAGGRRVWAAEAEELAELLEGAPAGAVLH